MEGSKQKMHVVAVDMGYGHQRAAFPLLGDSQSGTIITANNYPGISRRERRSWEKGRKWYEFISRFKDVPFLGRIAFSIMDHFQRIDPFYPKRDLSRLSRQQRYFLKLIIKGQGRQLIDLLNKNPLPLVTSFFVPAYQAEHHGYKGPIYCIICDADIARAWAPAKPKQSRIHYLVPNKRAKERLMLYGVAENKITITGFPLPKENIGGPSAPILKKDLAARIYKLDPSGIYRHKYHNLICDYLGSGKLKNPNRPVTITFAVGGAGAQREIGALLMERLIKHIKKGVIKLNLVAGVRNDVYNYFQKEVLKHKFKNGSVTIIYDEDKMRYFKAFNKALRTTDVLWTKPSELIFYAGLGLPIIMADPVGAQEKFNRDWLLGIGAGIDSGDPRYVDEWLFDWLNSGWLAEAAMQGYLDAPKMGTYNVENTVLRGKRTEVEDIHLL